MATTMDLTVSPPAHLPIHFLFQTSLPQAQSSESCLPPPAPCPPHAPSRCSILICGGVSHISACSFAVSPTPSISLTPALLLAHWEGRLRHFLPGRPCSLPAGLLASSLSLLPSILFAPPDQSSLSTAHCLSLPSSKTASSIACRPPTGTVCSSRPLSHTQAISWPVPLLLLLGLSGHHKLRSWLMSLSEAPGHQVVCPYPASLGS